MAIYEVKRLLTVAACDAALQTASEKIEDLEYKKATIMRRILVHNRVASKAKEELQHLTTELIVLDAVLANMEEARAIRECRYKIARAQCRIQFLELRLEDYSVPALIFKELKLQQAEAALREAAAFKTAIETHRNGLVQVLANEQPDAAVPPAVLVPLIASPQPVPHPKKIPTPQSANRSLKKRTG